MFTGMLALLVILIGSVVGATVDRAMGIDLSTIPVSKKLVHYTITSLTGGISALIWFS